MRSLVLLTALLFSSPALAQPEEPDPEWPMRWSSSALLELSPFYASTGASDALLDNEELYVGVSAPLVLGSRLDAAWQWYPYLDIGVAAGYRVILDFSPTGGLDTFVGQRLYILALAHGIIPIEGRQEVTIGVGLGYMAFWREEPAIHVEGEGALFAQGVVGEGTLAYFHPVSDALDLVVEGALSLDLLTITNGAGEFRDASIVSFIAALRGGVRWMW